MDVIIFSLLLVVSGVIVSMAYASHLFDKNSSSVKTVRQDLADAEKNLAHAISEIQILKGGMIENDELIDDLYEQGKAVASVVDKLEQPKRKSGRIINKLKKTQATSVKIKSPKDMVFHMSNKQKLSRRIK